MGIEAYQIPKYQLKSSFGEKNPSLKVLFSLVIVAFPLNITWDLCKGSSFMLPSNAFTLGSDKFLIFLEKIDEFADGLKGFTSGDDSAEKKQMRKNARVKCSDILLEQ